MRSFAVLLALVLAAGPAVADARPVAKPRFVRTIATGETGWFSSPGLADLDGDRRLEIVAPFYSTFVFDARGRLLGKGTATSGRVYAPARGRRPRRRRAQGDRRRRQRRHRGRVRAHRRPAPGQGRVAGVDLQRRSVPGGAGHGGRGPRRRRPRRGRRDHDEHGADRLAGLRVRRGRPAVPATGRRRRLAPLQHGRRRRLQRRRQPRLRRLRRERGDRPARRRSAARARRHVRQPPDQRLQPRRHVGARLAVVHQPRRAATPARGSAGGSSSAG